MSVVKTPTDLLTQRKAARQLGRSMCLRGLALETALFFTKEPFRDPDFTDSPAAS